MKTPDIEILEKLIFGSIGKRVKVEPQKERGKYSLFKNDVCVGSAWFDSFIKPHMELIDGENFGFDYSLKAMAVISEEEMENGDSEIADPENKEKMLEIIALLDEAHAYIKENKLWIKD